ncbi:MAG: DUF2066 domain-containing protein [Hyphomonadaceae bacterium]
MIRQLLLVLSLGFMSGLFAHADTRSLYTVMDIEVDESAASVIEAQQLGFAKARRVGVERMIERITLPADRAKLPPIEVDAALAQRLVRAVDVQQETRGGGRYIATLAAVMNWTNVRAFLNEQQLDYVDTQAPAALLVPVARNRILGDWHAAWGERNDGALVPYVTAQLPYSGSATWEDIQSEVGSSGTRRGILAELDGAEGAYSVRVSSLTASGKTVIGTSRRVATMAEAVSTVSGMMDDIWKEQSIVRPGTRTLSEASVLYTSLPEWNTLRGALARSPLVSDFQIKAIASDGAMVQFAFSGDVDRLQGDLRQRGAVLEGQPGRWVLRSAVSATR